MGLMAYGVIHDDDVPDYIRRQIVEAGGTISYSVLSAMLERQFGCKIRFTMDEKEIKVRGLMGTAFRLENGNVSLLEEADEDTLAAQLHG